ncbi:unnamed protein product [Effrenium voratum]|nr:unnamed protein product [Effrenium voratum]
MTSADLVAKLQPDPMHPWEKAPPPLAMKVPLQQLRSAAQEADTHPFNGRVLSRYCGVDLGTVSTHPGWVFSATGTPLGFFFSFLAVFRGVLCQFLDTPRIHMVIVPER